MAGKEDDLHIKIAGEWGRVSQVWIKKAGAHEPARAVWQKIGGSWQRVFRPAVFGFAPSVALTYQLNEATSSPDPTVDETLTFGVGPALATTENLDTGSAQLAIDSHTVSATSFGVSGSFSVSGGTAPYTWIAKKGPTQVGSGTITTQDGIDSYNDTNGSAGDSYTVTVTDDDNNTVSNTTVA